MSEYEVDGIQESWVLYLAYIQKTLKPNLHLHLQGFNLITYIPLGFMKLK